MSLVQERERAKRNHGEKHSVENRTEWGGNNSRDMDSVGGQKRKRQMLSAEASVQGQRAWGKSSGHSRTWSRPHPPLAQAASHMDGRDRGNL